MIKLAIFDLDGVLLHGRYFSDRFAEKYGVDTQEIIRILKEEIEQAKSTNLPTFPIWQKYLEMWNISLTEDEFFDFWFQGDSVVEEVLAIAKAVAAKVDKIAVLSDNPSERAAWLRKTFSFLQLFDKVYFSSERGVSKDHKEAFENVINDFGVKAEEIFFVDDSSGAIKVAQELGINAHQYNDVDSLKVALKELDIEI